MPVKLELRVSGLPPFSLAGGDGTNASCHGNTDGVDPNEKAIIPNVRVMVVCWGKFYDDHPDALDSAYALCKDLVTGPYLNGATQYGVGRGSMVGSARIVDTAPPATLSPDEARSRIVGFVRDTIPDKPAINEQALLYVLFTPPATKPTIASGNDDFCGYHDSAKFHDESAHNDLFYAVIRTDKGDTSSGTALIQSVSGCVSHEIAEAVTSRDGRGYFKGSCEIGDLCEQTGTHDYRGWQVEQYWSQWDRTCINGEAPVSVRRFLQAIGAGLNLRALNAPVINIEYIASRLR
jgi:hypothetical protein